MSAPGVGAYVATRNQSRGRIVDRRAHPAGFILYLVKLSTGALLWMRVEHFTVVDS